jgi:DNA-binding XRE family transcriptional regulator
MNVIEELQRRVLAQLPDVRVEIDLPDSATGPAWLDLVQDKHHVSVEWRPRLGIGVSAQVAADAFGEGPDEVYADIDQAATRIVELARSKAVTSAPREVLLRRLREVRELTQERLALELGIRQATISKLERRTDVYVSTLAKVVAALGGRLEIRARFAEGVVHLLQVGNLADPGSTRIRPRTRGDQPKDTGARS